ncbi:MAG: FimB/Mfa2 family fimbrial subunit [Bacteroides sp.]|nr:FimB/Mfa2 family fimbrial subunit [Bacteroides sp.]
MKEHADCPDPEPIPEPETPAVILRFRYDRNKYQTDRLRQEIRHLDLYVFDGNEALYLTRAIPVSELDENNSFSLELPSGTYTAIAWGNTDSEDYQIEQATHLSELAVALNHAPDGRVDWQTEHLFHGMVVFGYDAESVTRAEVDMRKKTNQVNVVIQGLETEAGQEAWDLVSVMMHGTNGCYAYDSSLTGSIHLTYLPEFTLTTDTDTGQWPAANFIVQHIAEEGDLMLTSIQPGYESPLIHTSVPALIKENYGGPDFKEYLDTEDEFTIRITVKKQKEDTIF